MNYILFDGPNRDALLPFTYTRPVADIRVGILQDRTFVAVRGELVPGATTGGAFNVVIDAGAPISIALGSAASFATDVVGPPAA